MLAAEELPKWIVPSKLLQTLQTLRNLCPRGAILRLMREAILSRNGYRAIPTAQCANIQFPEGRPID